MNMAQFSRADGLLQMESTKGAPFIRNVQLVIKLLFICISLYHEEFSISYTCTH